MRKMGTVCDFGSRESTGRVDFCAAQDEHWWELRSDVGDKQRIYIVCRMAIVLGPAPSHQLTETG